MKTITRIFAFTLMLATICVLFASCGSTSAVAGTYYSYENGELNTEIFWTLKSDKTWVDNDGMSGTYELDGTTIKIIWNGMEFYSGTIQDGKLTIGDMDYYIEGKEPTVGTSSPVTSTNESIYDTPIDSQGLEFEINDDGKSYSVIGIGTCKDNEIIIPSVHDNLPVTGIGFWAFRGCTSISSITIPDSITIIDENAFNGCTSLTSVSIPNSVTIIKIGAFSGCTSLTAITVDNDNKVYHSMNNCLIETATKTLIRGCKTSLIPSDGSVTSIGAGAFRGCLFTSVTIPNNIASIGSLAFDACPSLTDVYYTGTEAEWAAIEIDNRDADYASSNILYTNIHFNHKP